MLLLGVLTALLVLADAYISYKRIKTYGPFAEVNMLVRQTIADFGLLTGISVLLAYNSLVLGVLLYFHLNSALWFFCGAKVGLFVMQLKSLQMESFVERVLAKAKAKKS